MRPDPVLDEALRHGDVRVVVSGPTRWPYTARAGQPLVMIVRWPADASTREELAASGSPCLLMVATEADPPRLWGALEDWVREPADARDVASRANNLITRSLRGAVGAPTLDDDGLVHRGNRWAAVPPIEARLLSLLLDNTGELVRRDDLFASAWPDGVRTEKIIDQRMRHLRLRVAPLGISIRTVRGLGFLLELD